MPLVSNHPLETKTLDHESLAHISIEENKYAGRRWLEFYIVRGLLTDPNDENSFTEYKHPVTGEAARHLKVEMGVHPLAPDQALGKCDTCGKWFHLQGGPCQVEGCAGTIKPYDGWLRAIMLNRIYEMIKLCSYTFLTTEMVPDPTDLETMVPLWDAQYTPPTDEQLAPVRAALNALFGG